MDYLYNAKRICRNTDTCSRGVRTSENSLQLILLYAVKCHRTKLSLVFLFWLLPPPPLFFMEYVACMEVLEVKEDLHFLGSKVKGEVEDIF